MGMLALVGCSNKNKQPAASTDANKLTEVAPPPPVHQPVVPAQPAAMVTQTEFQPAPGAGGDIAAAPTGPSKAEAAPVAGKTYIVKKGDTLWGIAQRTYGDGKQYKKIAAANPTIKGNQVNVGQKIVLP
jgi:5'-nucleotidase